MQGRLSNNLMKVTVAKLFFLLCSGLVVVLWYYANSHEYTPSFLAPFTQIHAVLLAMAAPLLLSTPVPRKAVKYSCILLAFLGAYTSLCLLQCGINPWTLLWIAAAAISFNRTHKIEEKGSVEREIEFQDLGSAKANHFRNLPILQVAQQPMKPKTKISWKRLVLLLVYAALLLLFVNNSHTIASLSRQFPILGRTITMKVPGHNYKVTIHYYCADTHSQYPTIVLEHGGGGNMVGFLPLLNHLQAQGIKVCIYDRLGYGRSAKLIPNQTLREKMAITDLMLSLLLRTDEKVIYGGWSAGVELSIAYSYYFPERVKGLLFMDGYPDYLLLEAINSNSSSVRNPHTLLIVKIFRFVEPYGFDMLFGANEIANATWSDYYKAYYRTGYFWDSQEGELRFMNSTTELSEAGRESGAAVPYPDAKLYLNWPDISVPLLVMPANNTVSTEGGRQYKIQAQKYIEKCTSNIKRLEVIEGNHGFVLVSFEKVAAVIKQFVEDIAALH